MTASAAEKVNLERVLVATSLQGERIVSIIRVLMMLGRGSVMVLLANASAMHPQRAIGVGLYSLFAVVAVVLLFRAEPNPRRARWWHYFKGLVDVSFQFWMSYCDVLVGDPPKLEMTVVSYSCVILFCITSFDRWQPIVITLISMACYAQILVWKNAYEPASFVFTCLTWAFLCALVLWANRRVGRLAIDLRRRDGLSRMLPPAVVDRLMSLDDQALAPVQRTATVLFLDIRGFTTLSEKLSPSEVLALLDELLGRVSTRIKARGGLVNKFLGDGVLAFWNLPNVQEDHAKLALQAALDIREELARFNAERATRGEDPVRIGIGIHTGTVAAGTLGGQDQYEYTVIGDPVNLASRIEGLSKQFEVDVLVSGATWALAGESFRGRRLGFEQVRGRQEAVELYALEAGRRDTLAA